LRFIILTILRKAEVKNKTDEKVARK